MTNVKVKVDNGVLKANDKPVSNGELNKILDDPKSRVSTFSQTITRPPGSKKKITNKGFSLPKDLIVATSSLMDRTNASTAKMHFEKCGNIRNKSLMVIMYKGEELTQKQRFAFWLMKRWL